MVLKFRPVVLRVASANRVHGISRQTFSGTEFHTLQWLWAPLPQSEAAESPPAPSTFQRRTAPEIESEMSDSQLKGQHAATGRFRGSVRGSSRPDQCCTSFTAPQQATECRKTRRDVSDDTRPRQGGGWPRLDENRARAARLRRAGPPPTIPVQDHRAHKAGSAGPPVRCLSPAWPRKC